MDKTRGPGMPQACAAAALGGAVETQRRLAPPAVVRSTYLAALGASFTLFSSARVLAYLPTIWAVAATGDSSQHSLWTWFLFLGGNAIMAAWLWENDGRRCNRAIAASVGNAVMCLAIIAVIMWTRL